MLARSELHSVPLALEGGGVSLVRLQLAPLWPAGPRAGGGGERVGLTEYDDVPETLARAGGGRG